MKRLTKLIIVFMMITGFTAIQAQKEDYSNEPGYINFGNLSSLETNERVTEITIESHLLKMVSKLTKREDPELSQLIAGLKLINVFQYGVTNTNKEPAIKKIESIDKSLTGKNWDRIVRTRSSHEIANVYIKTVGDDKIKGLVVTSMENADEVTFVNIVGDIDLETIGRLSEKFDIPSLNNVKKGK